MTATERDVRMYLAIRRRRGVEVTYKRGDLTAPLVMNVGRTLFAANVDVGARVQWSERDYLALASELVAAGFGEPREGDRIIEGSLTFELQTPTGEKVWRYSDPGRQIVRLHCKRA